jgi:hypothetical protein
VRQTARHLAKRLLDPLPLIGHLNAILRAIIIAVGVLGGGTVLGLAIAPGFAVAAVFAFVAAFFGVAAWKLQSELDDRLESRMDCSGRLESVDWQVGPWNGRIFEHESVAWVTVFNNGPTSDFTARVLDVTGVPENWNQEMSYCVRQPLWETPPPKSTQRIESGGSRRIKLAAVLREPRAVWFYTSEAGIPDGPGHQLLLGEKGTADIHFVLEIVNSGDADQEMRQVGNIRVPANVADAEFQLAEPPGEHPGLTASTSRQA